MTPFGFHEVMPLDQGKAALLRWLRELATLPAGVNFEVGLTWDAEHKWRVYQRAGDAALFLSSEQARSLHRIYEKLRKKPEWRAAGDSMLHTLGALGGLASEAYHKNMDGIIPEGGVGFMPAQGRA